MMVVSRLIQVQPMLLLMRVKLNRRAANPVSNPVNKPRV